MTHPDPNITIKVDLTNPGQFFACCGLLELADRLWPGAEGWFGDDRFYVVCDGSLRTLLEALSITPIRSSVTDEGLRRLGTLLSAKKASLSNEDRQEKEMLRTMWQQERLHLEKPFDLWLDWWRDVRNERTPLKTWAAKQFVLEIVRPLLAATKSVTDEEPLEDILQRTSKVGGLPFYFDSHAQCQNTDVDTGFSLYKLRNVVKKRDSIKPILDLFAFFGMQRFQPQANQKSSTFRFNVWTVPLPVSLAAIAASETVYFSTDRVYKFQLLHRTKYMKSFLPATPIGASP